VQKRKQLRILDIGFRSYSESWDIQRETHRKRVCDDIPDTLILVEHPHVYTLGKNADAKHLIASENYLKNKGIDVVNVDRGGDITYHGPGQLVGYPIFNIKDHNMTVRRYVDSVEEVLIETLKSYDITAKRKKGITGVWVGDNKIGALGMRVSKWVTMHGFALNIMTDLSLFRGIIPCGISDKGITKMIDLVPDVTWNGVKSKIISKFETIFQFDEITTSE